ncbi:hypothetical protein DAEQUDRAFT_287013 [Daedalea quercina L-15889]|uniref:Uncharacterized protein n=1 Tax=Daedalea quercina L-15889 TaxID=1314783 RepID=A0A165TWC8_9APHY|nr:hypothetical protein DAEQUDRAFT_287013 [Daedalea quercina L-15889]
MHWAQLPYLPRGPKSFALQRFSLRPRKWLPARAKSLLIALMVSCFQPYSGSCRGFGHCVSLPPLSSPSDLAGKCIHRASRMALTIAGGIFERSSSVKEFSSFSREYPASTHGAGDCTQV